jgi:hypothetical protein
MTQAVYDGWKSDMLVGKVSLMAAPSNADVTRLSAQTRADRVQAGQIDPDGAELHDGNVAGRGDWIVTRHNDRRMTTCGGRDWVKNCHSWHVEHHHDDGSLTVRAMAHGGRVRLPAHYVAEHVELLYATTAHRAQGSTVDTAQPLITAGMTRESLYVLASRARERTTLYVATHDRPFDEDDHTDQVRTSPHACAAREILLNILATEATDLSATETITVAQEEAGSLATLVPRYEHAARQQAGHRYADVAVRVFGHQGGADLQADPAWPQVVRRLQEAEVGGWGPVRLLAAVAASRELPPRAWRKSWPGGSTDTWPTTRPRRGTTSHTNLPRPRGNAWLTSRGRPWDRKGPTSRRLRSPGQPSSPHSAEPRRPTSMQPNCYRTSFTRARSVPSAASVKPSPSGSTATSPPTPSPRARPPQREARCPG